jgi:hypothetical protein
MADPPSPPLSIEPPEGWGPRRVLVAELEKLGYHVQEQRYPGLGVSVLVITLSVLASP